MLRADNASFSKEFFIVNNGWVFGKYSFGFFMAFERARFFSEFVITAGKLKQGNERACGRFFEVAVLRVIAAGKRTFIPEYRFPQFMFLAE